MTQTPPDEIVRHIDLNATPSRVWEALSNSTQFSQWFQCTVDGPFEVGRTVNCRTTYEGGDAIWQKRVRAMEPERYFAFSWSPGSDGTGATMLNDEAGETLVEFTIERTQQGSRLTIRESGFAALPVSFADLSYRRNTQGWDAQVTNITDFLHA